MANCCSVPAVTVLYKKLIAGVLVALQQRAFAYLQLLDSGKYTHEQILEVLQFLQKQLYCKNPETKNLEDAELVIPISIRWIWFAPYVTIKDISSIL